MVWGGGTTKIRREAEIRGRRWQGRRNRLGKGDGTIQNPKRAWVYIQTYVYVIHSCAHFISPTSLTLHRTAPRCTFPFPSLRASCRLPRPRALSLLLSLASVSLVCLSYASLLCVVCVASVLMTCVRWPRQVTRRLEDLKEGEWLHGKVRNVERYDTCMIC